MIDRHAAPAIGPADERGCVAIRDLSIGEFLRLCERLSFIDLYPIGSRVPNETSVECRRARARLARDHCPPWIVELVEQEPGAGE